MCRKEEPMEKNIVKNSGRTSCGRQPRARRGGEIGIRIDQTTQDATGTMAYLQFEAMNVPRVRTELSVSYIDQQTHSTCFLKTRIIVKSLQGERRKSSASFCRAPGTEFCHQVHLERWPSGAKR